MGKMTKRFEVASEVSQETLKADIMGAKITKVASVRMQRVHSISKRYM